nr:hypothetical protein [Candidatus Electrothrix aestuarii]
MHCTSCWVEGELVWVELELFRLFSYFFWIEVRRRLAFSRVRLGKGRRSLLSCRDKEVTHELFLLIIYLREYFSSGRVQGNLLPSEVSQERINSWQAGSICQAFTALLSTILLIFFPVCMKRILVGTPRERRGMPRDESRGYYRLSLRDRGERPSRRDEANIA